VARIDAPRLNNLKIIYFHQLDFDTSQLVRFVNRIPMFTAKEAHLVYIGPVSWTGLMSATRLSIVPTTGDGQFSVQITGTHLRWDLSSLSRFCTSFSPIISTLELLYIYDLYLPRTQYQDDDINRQWLDTLRPFIAANELYLSKSFTSHIAPALQSLVGERVTEVLPSLKNIFLEGLQQSTPIPGLGGIQHFFALRLFSSHPIAISGWNEASRRAMMDEFSV